MMNGCDGNIGESRRFPEKNEEREYSEGATSPLAEHRQH
jgi:hypothetical protein